MEADEFSRKIENAKQQAESLQHHVEMGAEYRGQISPETTQALVDTLEELHVSQEELRLSNAELIEARLALESEKLRYYELFVFAPDGYLVTDALGLIKEANLMACAMLGVENSDQFNGKPLSLYIHEDDKRAFRRGLNTLKNQDLLTNWQITLAPSKKSDPFPVLLTVTTNRDAEGQLVGLRWLLRDISLRVNAEQALKESHSELEERVADRTHNLKIMVRSMAGREVRMAELKQVIKSLRNQLIAEGITPVADDPLLENLDNHR
ncbi:MAG: PAS domain-containing protein [Anaerolineales bacterium]|nr:PAS domain-containing protein [Chloroflexota bacterium]MBL6979600.1 PAS domain-containing protein [Anaerolineales bacterium]